MSRIAVSIDTLAAFANLPSNSCTCRPPNSLTAWVSAESRMPTARYMEPRSLSIRVCPSTVSPIGSASIHRLAGARLSCKCLLRASPPAMIALRIAFTEALSPVRMSRPSAATNARPGVVYSAGVPFTTSPTNSSIGLRGPSAVKSSPTTLSSPCSICSRCASSRSARVKLRSSSRRLNNGSPPSAASCMAGVTSMAWTVSVLASI